MPLTTTKNCRQLTPILGAQGRGQGAGGTLEKKVEMKGGAGQGSREMLTIPEKADVEKNMETDNWKLVEASGKQEDADGPILRGNLRKL